MNDDSLEAARLAIHFELAALVVFPSGDAHQTRERLLQNPESVSWTTEGDCPFINPLRKHGKLLVFVST